MKSSKFSEQQIALILKQVDDGAGIEDVCRKAGVSQQTYYRWRKKYVGPLHRRACRQNPGTCHSLLRQAQVNPRGSGAGVRLEGSGPLAYQNGVILDFSRTGKPTDNSFVEAFNGRVGAECVDQNWFL